MAGGKATVALLVDGEEPFNLQPGGDDDGAPGILLGRGGQSSPFLRDRLTDASISRKHVRVEALPDGGDGGRADLPPSARLTVVGSNPLVLIRRQPPGGRSLLRQGESAVAEAGDSFTFCRGFDGVVRIAAAGVGRSLHHKSGQEEEEGEGETRGVRIRGRGSDTEEVNGSTAAAVDAGPCAGAGSTDSGGSNKSGEGLAYGGEGIAEQQAESWVARTADTAPATAAPIADPLTPTADVLEGEGRRRHQQQRGAATRDVQDSAAVAAANAAVDTVSSAPRNCRRVGASPEDDRDPGGDTSSDGFSTASGGNETRQSGGGGAGFSGGFSGGVGGGEDYSGGGGGGGGSSGYDGDGGDGGIDGGRGRLGTAAVDGRPDGDRTVARTPGGDDGLREEKGSGLRGGDSDGVGGGGVGCGGGGETQTGTRETTGACSSGEALEPSRTLHGGDAPQTTNGVGEQCGGEKKRKWERVEDGSCRTGDVGALARGAPRRPTVVAKGADVNSTGKENDGSGGGGRSGRDGRDERWRRQQDLDSRSQQQQQIRAKRRKEERGDGEGGGGRASRKWGAADAAVPDVLRVALVGRGFSKERQELFRQRGAKLGMEVLVRPEAKAEKPPSLSELLPGGRAGGGGDAANGRKRRRNCRGKDTSSSTNVQHSSGERQQYDPLGGSGGGLLERLSREGFAVAVCSSDAAPPWTELLGSPPPAGATEAEETGASRGGGGKSGGRGGENHVEVVRDEWLVTCLREERRAPAGPFLLSPLHEGKHLRVGVAGADGHEGKEEGGGGGGGAREPAFVVPQYACQRPTPMKHHNHEIVAVLDEMSGMYKVTGDGNRADSFQRVASILRFLDRRVRSGSEVAHCHHVGERMVDCIDEIISTGTLSRLEELKSNPQNVACQQLMKVHGVGSKTAKDWYNMGIRTVDEAREMLLRDEVDDDDGDYGGDADLPPLKGETAMGLRHYHDMQVPIGRDEVAAIADEVREEAARLGRERDPEGTVFFEVCGGFRRGKEALHDVDILVSFRRGNGTSGHEGFIDGLKESLEKKGKLVATLYQGSMGGFTKQTKGTTLNEPKLEREEVLLALWQLPGRKSRIDIVQVPLPQWPFAVLGWSGTVMFEKDVRRYTEEQTEYKLSQKGITIRATDAPVDATFHTEQDIFDFLGLNYIPPHLRWA